MGGSGLSGRDGGMHSGQNLVSGSCWFSLQYLRRRVSLRLAVWLLVFISLARRVRWVGFKCGFCFVCRFCGKLVPAFFDCFCRRGGLFAPDSEAVRDAVAFFSWFVKGSLLRKQACGGWAGACPLGLGWVGIWFEVFRQSWPEGGGRGCAWFLPGGVGAWLPLV